MLCPGVPVDADEPSKSLQPNEPVSGFTAYRIQSPNPANVLIRFRFAFLFRQDGGFAGDDDPINCENPHEGDSVGVTMDVLVYKDVVRRAKLVAFSDGSVPSDETRAVVYPTAGKHHLRSWAGGSWYDVSVGTKCWENHRGNGAIRVPTDLFRVPFSHVAMQSGDGNIHWGNVCKYVRTGEKEVGQRLQPSRLDNLGFEAYVVPRFDSVVSSMSWRWLDEATVYGPGSSKPHFAPGDVEVVPGSFTSSAHTRLTHDYATWTLPDIEEPPALPGVAVTSYFHDPEYDPLHRAEALWDLSSLASTRSRASFSEKPVAALVSPHSAFYPGLPCTILTLDQQLVKLELWFGPDPVVPDRTTFAGARVLAHDGGLVQGAVLLRAHEGGDAALVLGPTAAETWLAAAPVLVVPINAAPAVSSSTRLARMSSPPGHAEETPVASGSASPATRPSSRGSRRDSLASAGYPAPVARRSADRGFAAGVVRWVPRRIGRGIGGRRSLDWRSGGGLGRWKRRRGLGGHKSVHGRHVYAEWLDKKANETRLVDIDLDHPAFQWSCQMTPGWGQ